MLFTPMTVSSIEVRHAPPAISQRVRAWFEKPSRIALVDGGRSIHLPHPDKRGYSLKIKGAGYRGGGVKFGTHVASGPTAPRFDFDGRMMVDVASGHNTAFVGGASFQQAATEFFMAQEFARLGIEVVACVGYGRIAHGEHVSWFSIHEWPTGYHDIGADETETYRLVNLNVSRIILELAQHHNKIGYFWMAQNAAGHQVAFDLHPFISVDPLNCSQLSWVMQLAFAYSVRCYACEIFSKLSGNQNQHADTAAYPLLAVLPNATQDDYNDLKIRLLKPAKKMVTSNFTAKKLVDLINGTRIGQALMYQCPDNYTRF